MAQIRIEWLTDRHECEVCGSSYAEGANVFIDDRLSLELKPVAHCFGGDDYQQDRVFSEILKHLGHEIVNGHD